jgi:hypothetical protein
MKRLLIFCCVVTLLLALSTVALAAGALNLAPVFGKVTYEDSDSNGFNDATWIGLRLQGEYELPRWQRLPQPLTVRLRYDYGKNDDAVGQDPQWRDLVPQMTTDGEVSQQTMVLSLLYPVGNFRFGPGYWVNWFKETEYGFAEHRDYQGLCLIGEGKITKDGLTRAGVLYAPTLSVDDDVKGYWNDPGKTAAVSYDGSYWELNLERTLVIRDRFNLTGGFNYSRLSGDGAYHKDYRFLQHDLTWKEFYLRAQWRY